MEASQVARRWLPLQKRCHGKAPLRGGFCRRQHSLLFATTLGWQETQLRLIRLKSLLTCRLLSKARPADTALRFSPACSIPLTEYFPFRQTTPERVGRPRIEEFQASTAGRTLESNTHGEKQQRRTSNTGNPKIPEPALL